MERDRIRNAIRVGTLGGIKAPIVRLLRVVVYVHTREGHDYGAAHYLYN